MGDLAEWCAWHKRNCRITKEALLVYIAPVVIGFFGLSNSKDDATVDPLPFTIVSALVVASVGFGIWLSKSILQRALAIIYVLVCVGDYIASLVGKDLDNWLLGCGLACFWITCYADGQDAIKRARRWRRDRD